MSYGTINADTLQNSGGFTASASSIPFRNRIINGAMNVWQRGTSFLNSANTFQYTADRWACFSGVGTTATFSQVSGIGLSGFTYALRLQRTSGSTGTATIDALQEIEFVNFQDLVGQTVTVSMWVRLGANYSGNQFIVGTSTGTGVDQGVASWLSGGWTSIAYQSNNFYSSLSTSWTKISFQCTIPSGSQSLMLYIQQVPSGTAGANDYYDITGVQIEKGSVASSFDYRPYGTELQLCQRYYASSTLSVPSTSYPAYNIQYKVSMRAAATITGGGTGFSPSNTTTEGFSCTQTLSAWLTLTFSAEL